MSTAEPWHRCYSAPMLVYAGIDEAGYGPMLGPLCVACTAFVLEQYEPAEGPPNLWTLLAGAVCRKSSDKKRRIAVDDSKKLKGAADGASHPLRHLERGVLSFCPGADPLPPTDDRLLALVTRKDRRPESWISRIRPRPGFHWVNNNSPRWRVLRQWIPSCCCSTNQRPTLTP